MGKKAKIVAAAAGLAAAATTAAVVIKRRSSVKKVATGSSSAKRAIYHVKRAGRHWAVHAEGAARASSLHPTKKEAVAAGRALASERRPSELLIHRLDGSVQDTRSYEKEDGDPRRRR